MMRLQKYAAVSFLATIAVIYHAFNSRGQFYPAMVFLSTSKICFVLLLNMGLVNMCILWQLVKRLFLGTLREPEVERLNEQAWRELIEIIFAITIFRQEFSVTSLAMVTALLLVKSLHWLAQKRVEYIETAPSVNLLSHIRIVSFMLFLLVVDCLFLHNALTSVIRTRQASPALFFSFEYTILASTTISILMKYAFYITDMLMEGQWEKKAVFTFYLELIRDLFNLSLYIVFFMVIFVHYGVPLHLIRELYETFRSFRNRIADYIRYRKVTSNMDERFPDATPEEINAGDETCIICREEMITAKKLLCGHLFHVHCLRSWLERQNTCPTCRALVVPPESGPGAAPHQHGNASNHQAGSSEASTSMQGSDGGVPGDYLSQHQVRLRAAAAAASIYEKSLSYPAAKSLMGSPGHSLLHPKVDASRQLQQPSVFSGYQRILMPSRVPASGFTFNQNTVGNPDLKVPILKAQQAFIQTQIEILQSELQSLQQQKADQPKEGSGTGERPESDVKEKGVVAVVAAASDSTASASLSDRDQDTEVHDAGGE
ncbi:ERAD-associated E3 ubiquitin-protein ligase HRD1B-like [Iris pallida]|uniref:RING-type E3 ubiquitin transferase n=1 Tax=Iris pallida TaxID=29817 RepID=A0AAX6H3R4_IRIPA|nr:ERAD-associated E3 ubiquitin-protein ligase HRD1B-like [Iris pallida]KAJ6835669.1 ERAD-associated E3 ubiquitin-protein ligase HRD1B-like [Iris pallida]